MTDKTLPRTGSFLFWICKLKKCCECKIEKELVEFSKHKNMKDGYQGRCKVCVKEYQIKNADKLKKYYKQYHLDNIDKLNQYIKQWRIDNAEHIKQCNNQYYQTPQGKLVNKSCRQKSRALKKSNTPIGKHWKPEEVILKLKLQKYKCIYCEKSIKDYHEVDHFVPLVKGGSNASSNIQLLCKECNRGKGGKWTKDAIEYAQKHGKLC